jgi:hypothetical protein
VILTLFLIVASVLAAGISILAWCAHNAPSDVELWPNLSDEQRARLL